MRLRQIFLLLLLGLLIYYVKTVPNPKGLTKVLADKITQGQKQVEDVLGITTGVLQKTVVKQTAKTVVDQIKKLPKEQQEEIKQAVCKP